VRTWWLSALVLLGACALTAGPSAAPPEAGDLVTVARVVDGDTFIAQAADRRFRVRLIGVDTPETVKPQTPVQCFGREASSYARRALDGRRVRLVYDVDKYDRYGRVLAYVYVGTEFFNLELVRRGYGVVLTVPPDVAHVDDFVAAQVSARTSGRGLWSACAP
jgi:micrococcal nuclease